MTARFFPRSVPATADPHTQPNLEKDLDGNPQVTIPFPGGSFLAATDPADLDNLARAAKAGSLLLKAALTEQAEQPALQT
jgi:hypothetical protein